MFSFMQWRDCILILLSNHTALFPVLFWFWFKLAKCIYLTWWCQILRDQSNITKWCHYKDKYCWRDLHFLYTLTRENKKKAMKQINVDYLEFIPKITKIYHSVKTMALQCFFWSMHDNSLLFISVVHGCHKKPVYW